MDTRSPKSGQVGEEAVLNRETNGTRQFGSEDWRRRASILIEAQG